VEEVEAVVADDEEAVVAVVALAEERETPSSAGDQTVQQQQSRTPYRSRPVTSAPLLCKVYSPRVVVAVHLRLTFSCPAVHA